MNSSILKAWHTKWIGKRKAKKKNEIIFVSDILNISHTTKHLNLSHKSNHPNENGENSIRSWKKNNKMVAQPIFMLHPITNHALFFITTPFPHTKKEKKKNIMCTDIRIRNAQISDITIADVVWVNGMEEK